MEKFLRTLNRELIRAGIWGRAARKLEQELVDHYLTAKAALVRQGKSEEEANRLALARLGDPLQLAEQARQELRSRDQSGAARIFLHLVPVALVPIAYAVFFLSARFVFDLGLVARIEGPPYAHPELLVSGALLSFFLVPWLVLFFWILRSCQRPVHGWRYLATVAGYVAASYFATALLIGWTGLLDPEFPPNWPHYLALVAVQSLVLFAIPWRVRVWKLRGGWAGHTETLSLTAVIGALALFFCVHSVPNDRLDDPQVVHTRERVRAHAHAELEKCRLAYLRGGRDGLNAYARKIRADPRYFTFVEWSRPHSPLPSPVLIHPPARILHWTIGRTDLPDGNVLFVGFAAAP